MQGRRRRGGRGGRTFENRVGRPPRFENEVAKIRCFPIFRVFWARLATLTTIRPPHSKIRGDAPVLMASCLTKFYRNRSRRSRDTELAV